MIELVSAIEDLLDEVKKLNSTMTLILDELIRSNENYVIKNGLEEIDSNRV